MSVVLESHVTHVIATDMKTGHIKKLYSTNLIDSLKVLNYATFFNGLLPYKLDKNGKIHLRKIKILMAIIHYVFFISCFWHYLDEVNRMFKLLFKSEVSYLVVLTYRYTIPFSVTFIFVVSIVRRKHLRNIMELFNEVEQLLKFGSFKYEYHKIVNANIIMVVMVFIYFLSCQVGNYLVWGTNELGSFFMNLVLTVPILYMWIYNLIFITFVFIMKMCLELINEVSDSNQK